MTALLLSLARGFAGFGGGTAARRYSTIAALLLMRTGGALTMALLALVTTAPWIGSQWP